MGLEAATFISQLNAAWPLGAADPKAQGDDHLRLLKSVLQAQFPNLGAAAVTRTAAQLNMAGTFAVPATQVGVVAAAEGAATTSLRSDARLQLDQAMAPTWTGLHTFAGVAPIVRIDETDAPANERIWLLNAVGGDLSWSTATDAAPGVVVNNMLTFSRTGTTVDAVSTAATLRGQRPLTSLANLGLLLASTYPALALDDNDASANNRFWTLEANAEQLKLRAYSDSGGSAGDIMTVERTAHVIDSLLFGAFPVNSAGVFDFNTTLGASLNLSSTLPGIVLNETDQAADGRRWAMYASAGNLNLSLLADASGSGVDVIRLARSTTSAVSCNITAPLLLATGIHNGTATGGAAAPALASGTFTPTNTNVANVAAFTARVCNYQRVGNVVTVSGSTNVDPTGAGLTQFRMTLPISVNFTASNQLAGTGAKGGTNPAVAEIFADTANEQALVTFIAPDGTAFELQWHYTYVIP